MSAYNTSSQVYLSNYQAWIGLLGTEVDVPGTNGAIKLALSRSVAPSVPGTLLPIITIMLPLTTDYLDDWCILRLLCLKLFNGVTHHRRWCAQSSMVAEVNNLLLCLKC